MHTLIALHLERAWDRAGEEIVLVLMSLV